MRSDLQVPIFSCLLVSPLLSPSCDVKYLFIEPKGCLFFYFKECLFVCPMVFFDFRIMPFSLAIDSRTCFSVSLAMFFSAFTLLLSFGSAVFTRKNHSAGFPSHTVEFSLSVCRQSLCCFSVEQCRSFGLSLFVTCIDLELYMSRC